MQDTEEVAPTAFWYEPATHDVQLVEPGSDVYVPCTHLAQELELAWPRRELKVPKGHAVQTTEEVAALTAP